MFRNRSWRVFLAGALCGSALMAVIWGASVWWKPHPRRSAADDTVYDACLVERQGNVAACNALMRIIDRERAVTAMERNVAALLAAGFSKREVVEWAREQGFDDSQVSDVVGISLEDLKAGKY